MKSIVQKGMRMASEAKTITSTGSTPPDTAVDEGEPFLHSRGEEEIRYRAYELYLQRGAQPGHELDDWLQAERDLSHNRPTGTASATLIVAEGAIPRRPKELVCF
jgi:hypothetical protein